ncbi:MAG: hypothetical protein K0U23_01665, partial [Gammaproteobacteria bacterium]|nr:hypothetical protein [Gammaproteobacteria bacterium]
SLDRGASAVQNHYSPGSVFDASESIPICDDSGVRIGFAVAVADGLGHPGDPKEQESLHHVAGTACSMFASRAAMQRQSESMLDCVVRTAGFSREARLAGDFGQYQSSSTLTGAMVVAQENGSYRASFCNVGDGLLLVLDGKTRAIKYFLPARDYNQPNMDSIYNYSPQMLQVEGDEAAMHSTLEQRVIIRENIEVAAGDFVVLVSDGIWPEFPVYNFLEDQMGPKVVRKTMESDADGTLREVKVEVAEYHEKSVTPEWFPEQLNIKLAGNENPTAYEIMIAINHMAAERALAARAEHAALVADISSGYKGSDTLLAYVQVENQRRYETAKSAYIQEKYSDEDPSTVSLSGAERKEVIANVKPMVMRELTDDLRDADQGDLADQLTQYCQPDKAAHDQVSFAAGLDTPAEVILASILNYAPGDCATVAVNQVPDLNYEVFRAFVESSDQQMSQLLLSRLLDAEKEVGDLDSYCRKLCAERHLREDNILLGSADPISSYNVAPVQARTEIAKQYFYLKNECSDDQAMAFIKSFVSDNAFWSAQARWTARLSPPTGIQKLRDQFGNSDIAAAGALKNIKGAIAARGKKAVQFCGLFTSNASRAESTVHFYESVEAANNWQELCGSVLLSAPALGMSGVFAEIVRNARDAPGGSLDLVAL